MWQPIETAPDDEFVVICCKSKDEKMSFFVAIKCLYEDSDEEKSWFTADPIESYFDLVEVAWSPRYWMHISEVNEAQ